MKRITFIAATAIIANAIASAPALAASPGSLYGGADIGYVMIPGKVTGYSTAPVVTNDANKDIAANPATPNSGKLKATGKGGIATVKLGYQLSDEIRTDLSFSYLFNQKNTLSKEGISAANGITTNASPQLERKSWIALANVYYHFKNSSDFEPFIGLSLGYGSTEYKVNSIAPYATTVQAAAAVGETPAIAASGTGLPIGASAATGGWVGQILTQTGDATKKTHNSFVYGATLGVAYKVTNDVDIDLYYGFRTLSKAETQISLYKAVPANATANPPVVASPAINDVLTKYKAPSLLHSINLGVRFYF